MTLTESQQFLLTSLLRDVSRSFYLTLRLLPGEIRTQISLGYLFARASDTIADTRVLPREKRLEALRTFQKNFASPHTHGVEIPSTDWAVLLRLQGNAPERVLLQNLDKCFGMLADLGSDDRALISQLLQTITEGQIFDLGTFPAEDEKELVALQTAEQLDRYTYLVAGCVGEFWTRMCLVHLSFPEKWKNGSMEPLAVRFGKGLQLVNILRDLPRDLRIGRCYLPDPELAAAGLTPADLLEPSNTSRLRAVYNRHIDQAFAHLNAGWHYTLQIPPEHWRMRLACALPILIGVKTLKRLQTSQRILDPKSPEKISRTEVYALMARTWLICRRDDKFDAFFRKLRE